MKPYLEEGVFSIGLLPSEFNADEVSRVIRMQTSRKNVTNNDDVYKTYVSALRSSKLKSDGGSTSLEDIIIKKRNNNT